MRDFYGKGNQSNLDTGLLSGTAVVDLLREVTAGHPELTGSNVYPKANEFNIVPYDRRIGY